MTRIHFRSSPLRSTADRIRQAVSFEIIGLAIVTPLFAWIFDQRMRDMGILALLGAAVATAWNYLFNLGFDHVLRWRRGDASKTLPIRLVHALLFEATRLLFLLLFAWWLAIPVLSALPVALSFAAFHVACAFLFTCGQDILFPREGADWEAA